jgi:hypothetical protein
MSAFVDSNRGVGCPQSTHWRGRGV